MNLARELPEKFI